jgi:hypothetical protein
MPGKHRHPCTATLSPNSPRPTSASTVYSETLTELNFSVSRHRPVEEFERESYALMP